MALCLAIMALGAALRWFHLGFHGLWYDEAFTAWVVAQRPQDILWVSVQDVVHPPLYYLLVSYVTRLAGHSEAGLRALSAVASLLGVPLVFQLGWRSWDRRTGLAAAFLWACLPFPLWYAQEARMYAMLTVVGLAATLCLARALPEGSPRWLVANAILNLAGLYTHNLYFLLVVGQYLYLTVTLREHRRTFWRWFAMNALAVLLYLPWVVALLQRGLSHAQIAWIKPLSLQSLGETMWQLAAGPKQPLSLPAALTALVLAIGLLAALLKGRGRRQSAIPGLVWMQFLSPLALLALISIRQPLFNARFLQIALPFALLLVAAGLMQIFRPWLATALVVIAVLGQIPGLQAMYATPARYAQDWKGAMRYLATRARPGDAVAFRGGQGWHSFWYYYNGPTLQEINLLPEQGVEGLSDEVTPSRRVWLVFWDVYRSCRMPAEFIPAPSGSVEIADAACYPEVLLTLYEERR